MKRFEFSLDRLLKVKRQIERLAELEQLRAHEALERARKRLEELHQQLTTVAEQFVASIGQPMAPLQWAAASARSERIGQLIRDAESEVAAAEAKLAAATQERMQVAAEVEALDTLREQQWTQWRQDVQQADQSRLDEVGLRRWMAAQKEEPSVPQGSP